MDRGRKAEPGPTCARGRGLRGRRDLQARKQGGGRGWSRGEAPARCPPAGPLLVKRGCEAQRNRDGKVWNGVRWFGTAEREARVREGA